MCKVVGYIRHYSMLDGKAAVCPGKQKRRVREIASRFGYGPPWTHWCYRCETSSGWLDDWPVLQEVINEAKCHEVGPHSDPDFLAVIPTLNGVEHDISFLELL